MTRAGIIARATTKEAIRQPLFSLLMAIALITLVMNTFLPFFSFGEDFKMLMDCGLATILICGLLLAVWTSSTSIADEIEGKTAMTLLVEADQSPAIHRRKIRRDHGGRLLAAAARDGLFPGPDLLQGRLRFPRDAPLPIRKRPSSCRDLQGHARLDSDFLRDFRADGAQRGDFDPRPDGRQYGDLLHDLRGRPPDSLLVERNVKGLEMVQFVARLIATALPNLEHFNTQAAVATGTLVPPAYLGFAALYCGGIQRGGDSAGLHSVRGSRPGMTAASCDGNATLPSTFEHNDEERRERRPHSRTAGQRG